MRSQIQQSGPGHAQRLRIDQVFRGRQPCFGEVIHGTWCGAEGFCARCRYCGEWIYFWTCSHLHGIWLPFEAWVNGRLEEGLWAFHGDGYCCLHKELS